MHRLRDASQAEGVRSRQLTLSRKVALEYRFEAVEIGESKAA
jgi:hypothetical protein